jgi:hypothetical protein
MYVPDNNSLLGSIVQQIVFVAEVSVSIPSYALDILLNKSTQDIFGMLNTQ